MDSFHIEALTTRIKRLERTSLVWRAMAFGLTAALIVCGFGAAQREPSAKSIEAREIVLVGTDGSAA